MTHEIPFRGIAAYMTLFLIVVIAATLSFYLTRKQGRRAALKTAAIAAALALPFTAGIAYSLSENELIIGEKTLTARGAYFYDYSRNIDEFDLSRAHAGTYASLAEASLTWRRNGVSLPGISAGHFSTAGDKRIFAVLTDRDSVLYLPAKKGPSLLVSVDAPAAVLASLRANVKRTN